MITKERFIKKYSKALQAGNAAIFTGAGASVSSGFINWKQLIKPFSDELGLDIEYEPDLVKVTQYYVNKKGGNRQNINQEILNKFAYTGQKNEVLPILARLPIYNYWTTNYDQLLENALRDNNRNPDVKITIDNLAQNLNNRDAIVYKMHGDQSRPEDAVITKDDYEEYNISHSLFTTALKGDLVSKTFLFIGFSFEDPNLEYVLSRIRILLNGQAREHYCFFKGMDQKDYLNSDGTLNEADFQRDQVRQKLKIDDLERFGINVILLDSYNEITEILEKIEKQYLYNSIFISGSIKQPENNWDTNSINNFCYSLSKKIVANDWKILSGFGLGIGSNIINGALETIYENKFKNSNDYLSLHPFPQVTPENKTLPEQWEKYRKNIISESGICIFIFGNKEENSQIVNANGMIQEYNIAKKMDKLIIPVGGTGGASKKIYDDMYQNKLDYPHLTDYWSDLDSDDPTKLTNTILKIISNANVI